MLKFQDLSFILGIRKSCNITISFVREMTHWICVTYVLFLTPVLFLKNIYLWIYTRICKKAGRTSCDEWYNIIVRFILSDYFKQQRNIFLSYTEKREDVWQYVLCPFLSM